MRSETEQLESLPGHLVTRTVDELHPDPIYTRHRLTVPISKLSALAARGNRFAVREPLVITKNGLPDAGFGCRSLCLGNRAENRLSHVQIEDMSELWASSHIVVATGAVGRPP